MYPKVGQPLGTKLLFCTSGQPWPVLSCHLIPGVAAHTTWRGIYYRPGDSGQAAKCPALNWQFARYKCLIRSSGSHRVLCSLTVTGVVAHRRGQVDTPSRRQPPGTAGLHPLRYRRTSRRWSQRRSPDISKQIVCATFSVKHWKMYAAKKYLSKIFLNWWKS
jgi:hypothetical protein